MRLYTGRTPRLLRAAATSASPLPVSAARRASEKPAAFSALTQAQLRQLRDLLDKVVEAQEADRVARADDVAAAS